MPVSSGSRSPMSSRTPAGDPRRWRGDLRRVPASDLRLHQLHGGRGPADRWTWAGRRPDVPLRLRRAARQPHVPWGDRRDLLAVRRGARSHRGVAVAHIVPPLCGGAQVKAGCRHEGSVPRPGICHADATDEGGSCGGGQPGAQFGIGNRDTEVVGAWRRRGGRPPLRRAPDGAAVPGEPATAVGRSRPSTSGTQVGKRYFHRGRGSRAPVHEERARGASRSAEDRAAEGCQAAPSSD